MLSKFSKMSCSLVVACGLAAPVVSFGQEMGGMGGSSTSKPSELTSADKTFIEEATYANMGEVEASKIALQKSSNEDVKKFAQQMIDDHTKANEELKSAAMAKGVTPPMEANADSKKTCDMLNKAEAGKDFDAAYVKAMVNDHENAVAKFDDESRKGGDADIKAWAGTTLPTLKSHLQMAKDLQDKMMKM